MPPAPQHPVRRCAPCDENWPNTSSYNLCPRCQRNTYASTDDAVPNTLDRAKDAARYAKYRAFDEQCDAGTLQFVDADWIAEMNALLELTPSIPDPAPTNYGLAGEGRRFRHDFHGGKPPTDEDVKRWSGDDA